MPPPPPVLWHIRISNFSEKARWALDLKGVTHRRRAVPPGIHMAVCLALTRRVVTVPVLQLDDATIGDSSRIIAALEERHPDPPLYPESAAERAQALGLEAFLDEHLGPHVRRYAFSEVFHDDALFALHLRRMVVPPLAPAATSAAPVLKALMRRRYAIDDASGQRSLQQVRAAMDALEELLGDREHLVGDRFTVADLTAAALLAPLLVPPGLPYRDPDEPMTARLREVVEELRARPAGRWVARTYARHRPRPAAEPVAAADRPAASGRRATGPAGEGASGRRPSPAG
jgi:glutathione S-transferase